jgi:Holliday junction resolvasome RuvABC endonuclease subunit
MTRIFTLDPALTSGYAVIDRKDMTHYSLDPAEITAYGEIKDINVKDHITQRLINIRTQLMQLLNKHIPDIMLLEDLNLTFDRQHKNREALQKYSAAWAVLYLTMHTWGTLRLASKPVKILVLPIPQASRKMGNRKKLIRHHVRMNYNVDIASTHINEAIYWGMMYQEVQRHETTNPV